MPQHKKKKCVKCNKCHHNQPRKAKENHAMGAIPVRKPHGKKYY